MQTAQYSEATVLLFDRQQAVRRQTRSILNVLGFKSFQEFSDLEAARHALSNHHIEVVVLALETEDCGVLNLIQDIRGGRHGLDPFVPILLTTWDAKMKALKPVIGAGADDILLYPFSTTQMGQRIEALTRQRKPFVISEDYFGPDRRSASALLADPTSIVVPNGLAARSLGRQDMAPNTARIEEALAELRRLKLRNIARRIWFLADNLKAALPDPSLPDRYDRELAKIQKSVRGFGTALMPSDPADLTTLYDSLSGVLTGLFGQPADAKGLFLLEQSALALRVASKLDHEGGDAGDAISDAVAETSRMQGDVIRPAWYNT